MDASGAEMDAVKTRPGSGSPVTPRPLMSLGRYVRVIDGAVRDFQRLLVRETERYRIVGNVRSLNPAAAAEIDGDPIRAVASGPESAMVELHPQRKQYRARTATLEYRSCGLFDRCAMFVAQR
jgi:hypothetical protein